VSNNFEFNLLSQGFLEDKKIEPLLIYTVENVFKSIGYEEFSVQFNHTFYDTTFTKGVVKFHTLKEIEKLQKSRLGATKKILVNIYGSFCNSCKVQNATTLRDTSITNYINKHFYVINFDAESTDTIMFRGEKCFKSIATGYPLNTFALKVTNNRLQFPSIAVLDEKQNTLDALNAFLSPTTLLPILKYYAEDKFKTVSWQDYIKTYNEQKK
jgi:thioredoxin-related protein